MQAFVWRGASRGARTRRPQPWGRRAIILMHAAPQGVCTERLSCVPACFGPPWSAGWSSFDRRELSGGARSAPVSGAEAGSMYAQGHRRLGAIVPNRRSGWAGVSQCKERLRASSQSRARASGGGFGFSAGGGAGGRGRPVSLGGGRLVRRAGDAASGEGRPAHAFGSPFVDSLSVLGCKIQCCTVRNGWFERSGGY